MTISCKFSTMLIVASSIFFGMTAFSQTKPVTDVTTPLHLLQPNYPIPYGAPDVESVKAVLYRIYSYLNEVTPAKIIDRKTNEEINNIQNLNKNAGWAKGDFRLTSYEWGVTYAGMLLAGEITGDQHFTDYTIKRLKLIADMAIFYTKHPDLCAGKYSPVHSVLHPNALDDAGAICAAMIKLSNSGNNADVLRPVIDNFIDYIYNKQFRLPDGILARNRPQPNTLWLDDLFMSVPALAQMGKLTGDNKYFDDAVKQILQFSKRMFNKKDGLYMHGWVQQMKVHPQFYWARANGWAVMAMVELLDVMPQTHSGYKVVLKQLKAHIKGIAACQGGTGFWHQLLDRNDSYLETSATAIYTYAIAKAINRGFIDPYAYTPVAVLAWNAVATKVNSNGQVEGTCVGTGMGFDPSFYYHRAINIFAAHGYGPVMLAGAEMIRLLQSRDIEINDSSLQLKVDSK